MNKNNQLPLIIKSLVLPLLAIFLFCSIFTSLEYTSINKSINGVTHEIYLIIEKRQALSSELNRVKLGVNNDYDKLNSIINSINQSFMLLKQLENENIPSTLVEHLALKYQLEHQLVEYIKSDMSIIKNSLQYTSGILWDNELKQNLTAKSNAQLKLLAKALQPNELNINLNWYSEVNTWLDQLKNVAPNNATLLLLDIHIVKTFEAHQKVEDNFLLLKQVNFIAEANLTINKMMEISDSAKNTADLFFNGLVVIVLTLAVFLIWISHKIRTYNDLLNIEIKQKKKNNLTLENLSKINETDFSNYLETTLKSLSQSSDADFIMVAFLKRHEHNVMTSKLVLCQNKVIDNESYPLEGSPCQEAIHLGKRYYDKGLLEKFPNNKILKKFNIKSYFGYALKSSSGEQYGTLSLMYFTENESREIADSILSTFATNISIEYEKHLLFKALKEQKELAEKTLETMTDGVITVDAKGYIQTINPAIANILKITDTQQYINQHIEDILKLDMTNNLSKLVKDCLEANNVIRIDNQKLWDIFKLNIYDISLVIAPIKNNNKQYVMFFIQDITQEKKYQEKLTYRASHDSLTGLKNRSYTIEKLIRMLANKAPSLNISLMYIDLDKFKIINDACGHSAGDIALKKSANILQNSTRESDIVARLGGDEFLIILQDCDLVSGEKIAQNILKKFEHLNLVFDNKEFNLSASIGLIEVNKPDIKYSDVISIADQACIEAKRKGKNCIVAKALTQANYNTKSETLWVPRISHAIKHDCFKLYMQPIIKSNDADNIEHIEVLLRLEENNKLIPPNEFIPAAERFELMYNVDQWVIENTFIQMNQQKLPGHIKTVAINLSGQSLSQPTIISFIKQKLLAYQIEPQTICFEITETSVIYNYSNASQLITELKLLGCRFALDDFGSGLSSYAYLRDLPVDIIKIDGEFSKNLTADKLNQAIVQSIIKLAKKLNILSVCEGVETNEISKKLTNYGVDYQQGYYYAKPFPFEQFNDNYQPLSAPKTKHKVLRN